MPITVNQAMVKTIAGEDMPVGIYPWDEPVITYSFNVDPGNLLQDVVGFIGLGGHFEPNRSPMSQDSTAAMTQIIGLWDDLIAPRFEFRAGDEDADITVNQVSNMPSGSNGFTYNTLMFPLLPNDADVFLRAEFEIARGMPGWETAAHEFGHAIGLQHPGSYDASDDGATTYADDRDYDEDTARYTLMSYFDPADDGTPAGWSRAEALTPMIYDILAAQRIYGADLDTRLGDTTYGFNSNADRTAFQLVTHATEPHRAATTPVFTIWDAGGSHDRIDASGYISAQRIDLAPGSYSDIGMHAVSGVSLSRNVGIAFDTWIEDAVGGGGNDTLLGNKFANRLEGGAGDDTLSAHEGDDTLLGGAGKDQLDGESGRDRLEGGADNDTLKGGLDDDVLLGEAGNDTLTGGFGVDQLDGGEGDDFLDGGGARDGGGSSGLVPDLLTGGAGNDGFVYATGYRSTVVTDFAQTTGNSDALNLAQTPAHSFEQLLAKGTQQGADTVFNFGGGDVLRLQNFTLADLDPGGISFSETPGAPGDFILAPEPYPWRFGFGPRTMALEGGGFIEMEVRINLVDFLSPPMTRIFANRYDERGVKLDSFDINTTTMRNKEADYGIRLATLTDGRIVVAWDSYEVPPGPDPTLGRTIRARILDADGTPIGDDFQVNTLPPVAQEDYRFPLYFRLVNVIPSVSGGFIVDWYSDVDPTPSGLPPDQIFHYRRGYEANGQPTGLEQMVGQSPGLSFPYEDIFTGETKTLDGGRVLHSWQNYALPDNYMHSFAQVIGETEVVRLDSLRSMSQPYYETLYLRGTELEDHRIVFTWWQRNFAEDTQTLILDADLHGFTRPGTAGDDLIEGSLYNDRLYGLGGDDTLIGNAADDLLDGGPGHDTADYRHSLSGVTVRLGIGNSGGHADGDTLVSIEKLNGSAYRDTLSGDAGPNIIRGSYGDDTLDGGDGGLDQLFGERGNDHLFLFGAEPASARGGPGNDEIRLLGSLGVGHGDEGHDEFLVRGSSNAAFGGPDDGNDRFEVSGSGNTVFGQGGNDFLIVEGLLAANDNSLYGGDGDDVFHSHATAGSNRFFGEDGADEALGLGAGALWLHGGAGDDTLQGGGGNDRLSGGADIDRLSGGPGADLFADTLAGIAGDTLTDLSTADRIRIEGDLLDQIGYDAVVGALRVAGPGIAEREIVVPTGLPTPLLRSDFVFVDGQYATELWFVLDSDGDGWGDDVDNAPHVPNPDQRDSDSDGYGNVIDADLNQDLMVDFSDLSLFEDRFFTADADADFNGDGLVDFADLSMLEDLFGRAPGAPPALPQAPGHALDDFVFDFNALQPAGLPALLHHDFFA